MDRISPPLRRSIARPLAVLVVSLVSILPASATSPGDGFAGSAGEAGRNPTATATRKAVGPTTPGLDVSHWQGDIDWAKVARTDRSFAFVKATEGDKYLDPLFGINRSGAKANGLVVGAYHFARPDRSAGDARREARWFVNHVDPKPGELLPVLDIETNKGLDQSAMTQWARRWVAEVRELTGVTPMIYTSPVGWQVRFGDTRRLARDGARLWVAHWGVSSPTLPAGDWDGHGWVVWQHTSDGHVAGIAGRVDLDRLAGTNLGTITIRRLSVTAEGGAGAVTSQPAGFGCRASCAHNVNPNATVSLTAVPDDHAYFTGWDGACSGTNPVCVVEMHGNRAVTAHFVTDITPPEPRLLPPSDHTAKVGVRFDEPVRGVNAASVVLRGATGRRLHGTRVCHSRKRIVPCSSRNIWAVWLSPAKPWVKGRDYRVVVNPRHASPAVKDRLGNVTPTTAMSFRGR